MTIQYYKYLNNNKNNLYDVMLDEYEIGTNSELIDHLFEELKEGILPLIPKDNESIKTIKYDYTDEELKNCANFLLDYIGFDLNKGMVGI